MNGEGRGDEESSASNYASYFKNVEGEDMSLRNQNILVMILERVG